MSPSSTNVRKTLAGEIRYGLRTLKQHGLRFLLLFLAVLLPLWGFGELAEEVHEGDTFAFDQPLLQWAESWHSPVMDRVFLFFSDIGYQWGVVPFDILLVSILRTLVEVAGFDEVAYLAARLCDRPLPGVCRFGLRRHLWLHRQPPRGPVKASVLSA